MSKKYKEKPTTDLPAPPGAAGPKTLLLDVARYEAYLADSDMSDAEKQEFLQALWSIIVEFVALGWGVHPLQQAQNCCGQAGKSAPAAAFAAASGVQLGDTELEDLGGA